MKESVFLSQTAYIEKMLERFNLNNLNEKNTPMAEGVRLEKMVESEILRSSSYYFKPRLEVCNIWSK